MTKQEHIDYWIKASNNDFEIFTLLYQKQRYLHAFLFADFFFKKLIKANWVWDNENIYPPKVNNFIDLIKQTKIELSGDQIKILTLLNDCQKQVNYPDYTQDLKKTLTKEYVETIFPKINEIRQNLIEMMG